MFHFSLEHTSHPSQTLVSVVVVVVVVVADKIILHSNAYANKIFITNILSRPTWIFRFKFSRAGSSRFHFISSIFSRVERWRRGDWWRGVLCRRGAWEPECGGAQKCHITSRLSAQARNGPHQGTVTTSSLQRWIEVLLSLYWYVLVGSFLKRKLGESRGNLARKTDGAPTPLPYVSFSHLFLGLGFLVISSSAHLLC